MWTENARLTSYRQWLAWQITIGHSIDPVDGVQLVETNEPGIRFKGEIIIEPKEKSIEEAIKYRAGLVMWTDRSKLENGRAGAAVCWKEKGLGLWKEKGVFLGKNKEILDAELWAISNALDIAAKKTPIAKDIPRKIFCDSQKALRAIKHSPYHKENRFLRGLIYEKAEKLENNGQYAAIQWIPGHSGLIGNEKAEQATRNKAERWGRQVERWSSLAHIRKNLTEARSQELAKWHEIKTQESDISRRGYYVPWTKGGINPTLPRNIHRGTTS